MSKAYLYLTKKDWAKTWIEGGQIPISLASKYRDIERKGIYTPDENMDRKLKGIGEDDFKGIINLDEGGIGKGSSVNVNIGTYISDGKLVGKDIVYKAEFVDGYILSFSNTCSVELMKQFGEKETCLEIFNLEELEKEISSQINLKGVVQNCTYTDGKNRDHFLKSIEDKWQDEVRIFWQPQSPDPKMEILVNIKPNSGQIAL